MTDSSPNTSASTANSEFLGLAALMRRSLAGEDLAPLYQSLIARAQADGTETAALMDASLILQFYGDPDMAMQLQEAALVSQRVFHLPARREPALRVLAIMAPGPINANVPLECLLEDSDIDLHLFYAPESPTGPIELPDHDLLVVAIGEAEANRQLLVNWTQQLDTWSAPLLLNPHHILRVARDTAAELLHGLPGVLMPPTARLTRTDFATGLPASMNFPVIVRPLDSHAGYDLYKIDDPPALDAQLRAMVGDEFFIAPFIDYRSGDGQFRKYRIMLIDGKPFAGHMAISDHWMIHYLNAGMADSSAKRAEEADFMENFDQGFAQRHGAALDTIYKAIGLEYLGIDCAETRDGQLVIFEVDHAMVIHAMDPVDLFPYKQPAMAKIFAAFRALLFKAAGREAPAQPRSTSRL